MTNTDHVTPDASTALSDDRLAAYAALAARVAGDPFFVSDCEGKLTVWRESALTHVRRDEHGQIDMYSFPSSYRSTDEVIEEIHLDSWDPGEDATDDQRRQDINDLVDARAAVGALLAEVRRQRARIAELEEAQRLEWVHSQHVTPHTPRLCACGHSHHAHTVPAPHFCFAHGQTCPCEAYQQLPHDEAVAQLRRNQQAAVERAAVEEEPETGTRPCGHDDYHAPHEWADRPGVWCPGISHTDDEAVTA